MWKTAGMKQGKYINEVEAETDRYGRKPAETFSLQLLKCCGAAFREAAFNLSSKKRKVTALVYKDGQVSKRWHEKKVSREHETFGFTSSAQGKSKVHPLHDAQLRLENSLV